MSKQRSALFSILMVLHVVSAFGIRICASEELVHRSGDWTVKGSEFVRNQKIRLDGNLILTKGTKLTLEDCTLEIAGEFSRQHSVEWKGGTLVTRNCKIGGFVNKAGAAIHTVFHLYDGLWEANETTVSYSYGISFHWEKGKGILRGNGLKAGPRPDAIILSGEADVALIDSDFPIGLGLYCNKGGKTSLDLMPAESVTATFDRKTLLPGVNWRLQLKNTRVERWFLFLRRIGGWQPPAEVTIGKSKEVIVSLFSHNLKGTVKLTNDLNDPLRIGNLTLKRNDETPSGISMYALYLSGDETDATIIGRTHICEWMQSGGVVRVKGLENSNDLTFGCTTLELSGKAQLLAEKVHFGRPLQWQPENNLGEANIKGNSKLIARHVSTNNLRIRTKDNGSATFQISNQVGSLESIENGKSIKIQKLIEGNSSTKPKVWIFTDMTNPRLNGSNKHDTINDPDDVSTMAGYLLMASEFETLGVVVASTHRTEHRSTPDQAVWANRFFGDAYSTDVQLLNKRIGGYPKEIKFRQSCIKTTGERFKTSSDYSSLEGYKSVKVLFEEIKVLNDDETINVLCWGSLTEPAILVAHCIQSKQKKLLKRIRFIAHWTNSSVHQGSPNHPERVANCKEDANACAYLKQMAKDGWIMYHECGAIGQHGIVSGSPKGKEYFDQFRSSKLGTIFVEGKYVFNCVDHSDSATYWTLLSNWGVSLDDIKINGTNDQKIELKNERAFRKASKRIHDELLRRARLASNDTK